MTIRINLLAEAQEQEELRRRDPVKRAIWICAFLVALELLWSLYLGLEAWQARRQMAQHDASWAKIETPYTALTKDLAQTRDAEQKLAAVYTLATNRFLLGPLLNAVPVALVDNIQLTRMRIEQVYVTAEATKATTNTAKVVVPGKPAKATERIALIIEGRDTSNPPGDQVNRFKQALAASPYFQEHFKLPDSIRLTQLMRQADPADPSRALVVFTFECRFPERTR